MLVVGIKKRTEPKKLRNFNVMLVPVTSPLDTGGYLWDGLYYQ
jgi:hypothetical protein